MYASASTHTLAQIHSHTHTLTPPPPTHSLSHTHTLAHLYSFPECSVGIKLAKQLVCGKVKGWNDLLWIAYELGVEISAKLSKMIATDIQKWLFKSVDLDGGRWWREDVRYILSSQQLL